MITAGNRRVEYYDEKRLRHHYCFYIRFYILFSLLPCLSLSLLFLLLELRYVFVLF